MTCRWREENYFRYGHAHFAPGALDSYATVPDDPRRLVPNPAKKTAAAAVTAAKNAAAKAEAARARLEAAQAAARAVLAKIPLSQHNPRQVRLEIGTKLITHAIRMAACNAETILARALHGHYAHPALRSQRTPRHCMNDLPMSGVLNTGYLRGSRNSRHAGGLAWS